MSRSAGAHILFDKAELDRELSPILAELITLGPGNDQHPSVRQLSKWLVDSHLTGEEYAYVVGQLVHDVYDIMSNHFMQYRYDEVDFPYLTSTVTEALAIRFPVLEGPCELASWFILIGSARMGLYEVISNRLSTWIIKVIADPIICPNPYLRFEFISLLIRMVEVNDCNRIQILESVLFACSCLNVDYMSSSILEFHKTHAIESVLSSDLNNIDHLKICLKYFARIEIRDITDYIDKLSEGGHLLEFDKNLAEKLMNLKTSKCAALVHDVTHLSALYTSRFTEPNELHGLLTILKATAKWAQSSFQATQSEDGYDVYDLSGSILSMCNALFDLIHHFISSCHTPQLLSLTSACVMDIAKLLIKISADLDDEDHMYSINQGGLYKFKQILYEFDVDDDEVLPLTNMPVHLDIIKRHLRRSNKNTWNLNDCYDIFHEIFYF